MNIKSQSDHEQEAASISNKFMKIHTTKQYKKMKEAADVEASFYNHKKVQYLGWDPELNATGKPLAFIDGSLKGRYVVQYKDKYKELQSVEVPFDWAKISLE